jgi:hypothetical protein
MFSRLTLSNLSTTTFGCGISLVPWPFRVGEPLFRRLALVGRAVLLLSEDPVALLGIDRPFLGGILGDGVSIRSVGHGRAIPRTHLIHAPKHTMVPLLSRRCRGKDILAACV